MSTVLEQLAIEIRALRALVEKKDAEIIELKARLIYAMALMPQEPMCTEVNFSCDFRAFESETEECPCEWEQNIVQNKIRENRQ